MIAEVIGLVVFLAITIFFVWRISVNNRTLFESPVFRTFVPIVVISIMVAYIIIVLFRWNPTRSLTGITTITLLAATGAYLQMPFGSEHFLAHLKIVNYDIAPKGSWIEVETSHSKIIGMVISLKTTAVTLRDEEGCLHTIENQTFLNGNPRRLEITQSDGSISNIYQYRVNVALPYEVNKDYMSIKQLLRTKIINQQLSKYSTDETGAKGEAVDTKTMTGFVFDTSGTHISPRIYFDILPTLSGNPYVQFVVLIPSSNYYEGWARWHSFIGELALQCYVDAG